MVSKMLGQCCPLSMDSCLLGRKVSYNGNHELPLGLLKKRFSCFTNLSSQGESTENWTSKCYPHGCDGWNIQWVSMFSFWIGFSASEVVNSKYTRGTCKVRRTCNGCVTWWKSMAKAKCFSNGLDGAKLCQPAVRQPGAASSIWWQHAHGVRLPPWGLTF